MFSGRHFDRSVILLCVRWYHLAAPHRGVVDQRLEFRELDPRGLGVNLPADE